MPLEILTPCRDQSHEEACCAVNCPELNDPVWNEFLGGWFHVVQLLSPQERTARAHADLHDQADRERRASEARIRAKTAAMEDLYFGPGGHGRTTGGFAHFAEFVMPSPEEWVREHLRTEPSDPGTTMPPQLDP